MPHNVSPTEELRYQARMLIAIRVCLYIGCMGCYFIGVMGTLTFAMGGGVVENALAVALLNLSLMVGGVVGGKALDAVGPSRYLRVCAGAEVASGLLYQVLGSSVAGVLTGAALFGFAFGMADIVARSYAAYLTGDTGELKRINSAVTLASNVSVAVGPMIGGAIALAAPTQAVFLFMAACAALALVPASRFRRLRDPSSADAKGPEGSEGLADGASVRAGFAQIFGSEVLSLLFWATMLSFLGYGAFDPLESLFYRDVLKVGASWMGWLSALAGVGGIVGACLSGRIPTGHVNVRTMLAVLAVHGAGCLLYVSTPNVAVACAGQFTLGAAFSAFGPIKDTLVQVHTPLSRIGRVNAAMSAGYNLAGVVPLLCAPAIAAALGVQGTLVGAGVVVTAIPLFIIVTHGHRLASMVARERGRGYSGEGNQGE